MSKSKIRIFCEKDQFKIWLEPGWINLVRESDQESFRGEALRFFSGMDSAGQIVHHFALYKRDYQNLIVVLSSDPDPQGEGSDPLTLMNGALKYVDEDGIEWTVSPREHPNQYWFLGRHNQKLFIGRYESPGQQGNFLEMGHFTYYGKGIDERTISFVGLSWFWQHSNVHKVEKYN